MLGKDAFVVVHTYNLGSRADAIEIALTKGFTIGREAVPAGDGSGEDAAPTILLTVSIQRE